MMNTYERKELYARWKSLEFVNMSSSELKSFMNSPYGKVAGLSKSQAQQLGIKSGQESARAILRMKKKSVKNWTKTDLEWAKRQINFIARSSGQLKKVAKRKGIKAALYKSNGEPTRLHLALLIWGHDPYPFVRIK